MKKNWNNPELKNLSLVSTNEEVAPLYYDPTAGQYAVCTNNGISTYKGICQYPLAACSYFTPLKEGICNVAKCKYQASSSNGDPVSGS